MLLLLMLCAAKQKLDSDLAPKENAHVEITQTSCLSYSSHCCNKIP